MGYPVVHFEVTGTDGPKLHSFFSEVFEWEIDANNDFNYGIVQGYKDANGNGIGGGIAQGPDGYPGHVTFYVEVPDVEAVMAKAESLGGSRMMGPEEIMPGLEIGLFTTPEGHVIGAMKNTSPEGHSGS